jgi:hypothetical protein
MSSLTREDILAAIRKVAETTRNYLTLLDFTEKSGITHYQVLRFFASWSEACVAAGLSSRVINAPIPPEEALEDWARVVRLLGKLPTKTAYTIRGKFSAVAFLRHFGAWHEIPDKFRDFAQGKPEWDDVVKLLPAAGDLSWSWRKRKAAGIPKATSRTKPGQLPDRPLYGEPIAYRGLGHSPVNEQGVVLLFGMMAPELGFIIDSVQTAFPDCEAKRQIEPGKWQRVRIEFEFQSQGFVTHGHPVNGCDLIVCWEHNWHDCPLEVIELREELKRGTVAEEESAKQRVGQGRKK